MNETALKNENVNSYSANLDKCLKKGYKEMSPINLSLAEDAVQSDNEAQLLSEQNLRSVKLSDS